ncbi:hypothetical protein EIN_192710 [Entamoeba invadens IP1]|uniref:Leucine rich repeat containing protein BspA family protein n=1 Tax=Entamoeba invadens IP1 TaxID=370355 RepID=A0A0A1U3E8_ENTIV|nr:hypothetical protein EIN_192710 [Entamoeba invadens IP1]ELP88672.1 hypothetical protein EIN_192710 [Entamoeba invadens IP1]|eukprot:XP_004255443.1 hypothetical protein EIN_192710 [Entamoeba invadens IP1]
MFSLKFFHNEKNKVSTMFPTKHCNLDTYHMMVVSKYLFTIKDFTTIQMVSHKYQDFMELFHFNPVPVTEKTLKYFPNIETLNLWSDKADTFGNIIYIHKYPYKPRESDDYDDSRFRNFTEKQLYEFKHGFIHKIGTNSTLIMNFFKINIWFEVNYQTVLDNEKNEEIFKETKFLFGNVVYTKKDRKHHTIEIPVDNKTLKRVSYIITQIGDRCLRGLVLNCYEIPNGVTRLCSSSFEYVSALKIIQFPKGILSFESYSFARCNSLESVEIPDSVTFIGEYCFTSCQKLSRIQIGKGVKTLENGTFEYLPVLEQIVIPSNVDVIKRNCFDGCKALKSVIVENKKCCIDERSFTRCSNLKDIQN